MAVKQLAAQQGKEAALQALATRRQENAAKEKIDNASLPAGSSMYYYCISCGGLADVKNEGWFLLSAQKALRRMPGSQRPGLARVINLPSNGSLTENGHLFCRYKVS